MGMVYSWSVRGGGKEGGHKSLLKRRRGCGAHFIELAGAGSSVGGFPFDPSLCEQTNTLYIKHRVSVTFRQMFLSSLALQRRYYSPSHMYTTVSEGAGKTVITPPHGR